MNNRPATISPSNLSKILTKKPVTESKGAETYADKILMRKIGVDFSDEYESYDMIRGTELEPDAIYTYQQETLKTVEPKERLFHPDYDYISGEPDGLIGDDGIIEIKCPKNKWHLANLRDGEQIDKYYDQMQGYLFITGRDWCDFVSYNPNFPVGHELAIHRVERDQEHIDFIEERCQIFWNEVFMPRYESFKSNS